MTDTTMSLAQIAQSLWRRTMESKGWRPGVYNPAAKTHDALVPFEDLEKHDRRRLLEAIAYLELEPELEAAVEHQRGPDREFTLEEMRPGLLVTWAEGTEFDGPDLSGAQGHIESWSAARRDPQRLEVMRVRWEDGTVSEHEPSERELRRVEP